MKSKKSLIGNLPDIYKNQIQKLSNEGLKLIILKKEKAVEYAKKGIVQTEPEKLNEKHTALIADSMQVLARIVLEERGISTNN